MRCDISAVEVDSRASPIKPQLGTTLRAKASDRSRAPPTLLFRTIKTSRRKRTVRGRREKTSDGSAPLEGLSSSIENNKIKKWDGTRLPWDDKNLTQQLQRNAHSEGIIHTGPLTREVDSRSASFFSVAGAYGISQNERDHDAAGSVPRRTRQGTGIFARLHEIIKSVMRAGGVAGGGTSSQPLYEPAFRAAAGAAHRRATSAPKRRIANQQARITTSHMRRCVHKMNDHRNQYGKRLRTARPAGAGGRRRPQISSLVLTIHTALAARRTHKT
ncbi:hypothetical protein EVAR_14648_1 [Eumeta japonica]|uniref:Uncharacterized protein n=1 Tax=Eumeta variegata TaxID=151549 RepID=A0A4C1U290_EUMVA|nr:hypothetical protein EVAR_14648_1 [Eumeta japonica]